MKELLKAAKTEIKASVSSVRDDAVYITPAVNFLPSGVKTPCIGIKDGKVIRKELTGGVIEKTLQVTYVATVSLSKKEASIIGDESSDQPGVLDVIGDIEENMTGKLLSITGMQLARPIAESESLLFIDTKGNELQQKTITFEYVKER